MHLCFDVVAFAGDAAHAVLLPVQRGAREAGGVPCQPSSGSRVSRLSKEAIALRVDWVSLKTLMNSPARALFSSSSSPNSWNSFLNRSAPELPLGGHPVEYRVEAPAELAPFGHQIELMRLADAGGTRKQVRKDGLTPRFGIAQAQRDEGIVHGVGGAPGDFGPRGAGPRCRRWGPPRCAGAGG